MNWKNPLNDPIPGILYEAHSWASRNKPHPCNLCRTGSTELHFHGSDNGRCPRRVQYSKMYKKLDSGGTTPEFFDDGHLHENSMLVKIHNGLQANEDIKELYDKATVLPSVNREELTYILQYKLKGKDVQEIKIIAHYDGLLICQKESNHLQFGDKFLLECKAVKDEKYYTIKNGELDDEWYGQVQMYLQILNKQIGLDRAYLLVKNRTTGLILPPIRVDLDSSYLKEKRSMFIKIHQALLNKTLVDRKYEDRRNSECKYCPWGTERGNGECWKKEEQYANKETNTVRLPKTIKQRKG